MAIKIAGLVRFFNRVRAQLQAGLHPREVAQFQYDVREAIQQVEEICGLYGATPAHLPGPSRMAYSFLKNLDLAKLPLKQKGESAGAPVVVKLKNVVKLGEGIAERLWQSHETLASTPDLRDTLQDQLRLDTSRIEQLCGQQRQTPAALETPSRQVYCWLKYLSIEDNLTAHLAALANAREAMSEFPLTPPRKVHLHLVGMSAIWRMKEYRGVLLIKVNQGFMPAEKPVWRALLGPLLSGRQPADKNLLHEFTGSEEFSNVLFEMESLAAPPGPLTRGRAHDLEDSFARVNRTYFAGQMAKPTLTWNRTLTVRKFGHYQPSRDTVMLSATLDHPDVPAMVVDYVMYHELLHKKHGATLVNGRRVVHGPTFRADERRFADWQTAEKLLNQIARRQHNT